MNLPQSDETASIFFSLESWAVARRTLGDDYSKNVKIHRWDDSVTVTKSTGFGRTTHRSDLNGLRFPGLQILGHVKTCQFPRSGVGSFSMSKMMKVFSEINSTSP